MMYNQEQITLLQSQYPTGSKILCTYMLNEPQYNNRTGTVQYVDDLGQIHVNWDHGGTLALIPEKDHFEKIKE